MRDELCKIYNKLTNQTIEGSQSLVKEKIKSHINAMSCSYKLLVILDDVWEANDALTYVEVFQSCKILLTTRKSILNSKIPTKNSIDIEPMELDEAVKLLTSRIDAFKTLDDRARVMIYKLAEYLCCWPLLLNLVRTQLYIYCTEWKMSPTKAMESVTQKLSKSFTVFDETSREKAVKICLDTSLNMLPEQSNCKKVLHCIILTMGGLGPYAVKDSVAKASKIGSEQFSTSITTLWSHGLIELIEIPAYPTDKYISCIGVHHIVAHYITEIIPVEQLQEIMGSIMDFDVYIHDVLGVYNEKNVVESNLSMFRLHVILNTILYCIRVTSVLSCVLEKMLPDSDANSKAITDELTMENKYSKMNKDCALVASLLADNKHNIAMEWVDNHYRTHPIVHMRKRFSNDVVLDGKSFKLDDATIMVDGIIYMCLIPFITLHKCVEVLTKLKASNEDISHLICCCNNECWKVLYAYE